MCICRTFPESLPVLHILPDEPGPLRNSQAVGISRGLLQRFPKTLRLTKKIFCTHRHDRSLMPPLSAISGRSE
ncbi:unnamed protein product [Mycena citricolor]|uniref:Uncharacterized protein n=1 Tax=Mycena citricolor TaxID=2018698 RepID=A0AAD2HAN7_9AGAR|nr:unnamed protein product [Mycena citricolor]